jgi:hypothetical protein
LASEAYEGKHVADSQCHLPQATLNKHAVEDLAEDTYGNGTRDMVLFVASRLYKATRAGRFNRGRWSPDHFLHMYYDHATGFDRAICPPTDCWDGPTQYSVHWNASGGLIGRRLKFCFCHPCSEKRMSSCLSNAAGGMRWYGGAGVSNHTKLIPKAKPPAPKKTRSKSKSPIEQILSLAALTTINKGSGSKSVHRMLVATRIHPDDPNTAGEEYYLVKPVKKPWKTDGKALADGVEYEKGLWLFQGQYFQFERTQEADGYRVYTLLDGPGSISTFQVGSVVCGTGDIEFCKIQRNDAKIDEYVLAKATDNALVTKGDVHNVT